MNTDNDNNYLNYLRIGQEVRGIYLDEKRYIWLY